MPTFKVIKAHDGIPEGTTKSLPASAVTRYMVEAGYWEEIPGEPAPKPARKPATRKPSPKV